MPRDIANALCWCAAIAAWLTVGCGSSDHVRVSGKLVKDGAPYTAQLGGSEPETFAVDFTGSTPQGEKVLHSASLSADGSFRVDGPDGRGIPKGKYRIAVLHSGFLGAGGDRFKARFNSEKTPLAVDLTKNANLTIDVGAGTVSQ